jgi:hypothetical protein
LTPKIDHHFASYPKSSGFQQGTKCNELPSHERYESLLPVPRFWVSKNELFARMNKTNWNRVYLIGYRDVTNATNERTCIACFLPFVATDDTVRIIFPLYGDVSLHCCLVANLNSFVLDYAARNTVASTHLSEYLAKQLPILKTIHYTGKQYPFSRPTGLTKWIGERVLELTYTAQDMEPFARSIGYQGRSFKWNKERRFLIRCELDAAFFHLYEIARDDVDYIMETFPIVKRKDEQKYGEFRTKRVILGCYDAMAEAMKTGRPYQTILDPPPADPRVAHPSK